jgi:hypothetical protein
MSDDTEYDRNEHTPEDRRQGLDSSDILAVLAVSSFLGAIALTTFFLTTALAHQ